MSATSYQQAWNNFVMHSDPNEPNADRAKRSAAIANMYMGGANNGGINSFLTASHDIGSQEVLDALKQVGAVEAARQLAEVLAALGQALPPATQHERWQILEQLWTEVLDEHDVLEAQADAELMSVLERHVSQHESYYLALASTRS